MSHPPPHHPITFRGSECEEGVLNLYGWTVRGRTWGIPPWSLSNSSRMQVWLGLWNPTHSGVPPPLTVWGWLVGGPPYSMHSPTFYMDSPSQNLDFHILDVTLGWTDCLGFGLRLVNIFTICRLDSIFSVVAKIEQGLTLGCYIIGLKPERGFMSPLTMAIYCLAECMVYARWILAPVINGQECGMWTHLKGRICRDLRFYQQFIYSRQLLLAPRHNQPRILHELDRSHLHRWQKVKYNY